MKIGLHKLNMAKNWSKLNMVKIGLFEQFSLNEIFGLLILKKLKSSQVRGLFFCKHYKCVKVLRRNERFLAPGHGWTGSFAVGEKGLS